MIHKIAIPLKFRPHDLVWIDGPQAFVADAPAPAWVVEMLAAEPVMVVRRSRAPLGLIPVGVRGRSREQRFAGAVAPQCIIRLRKPEDLLLRRQEPTPARREAIPALNGFYAVLSAWSDLDLPWGPVGSVGFELATGAPAATASSDLDLVVRAYSYLSEQTGHRLLDAVAGIPAVADIQVETPHGSFSLREYCDGRSSRRRLKTCDGSRLVSDPWSNTQGEYA